MPQKGMAFDESDMHLLRNIGGATKCWRVYVMSYNVKILSIKASIKVFYKFSKTFVLGAET